MKIINMVTGLATIAAQPITKSAGTLLFQTDKTFAEIANETVTIRVERTGATDVYICTDAYLKDLILLSLHENNSGLLKDPTGVMKTVCLIELGFEAGVLLSNSDKIHVRFDGCDAAKKYDLSILEDLGNENTKSHIYLEKKSISSEDSEKWLDVSAYSSALFVVDANVKEIGIRTGAVEKRYTPNEFRYLVQEGQPVLDFGAAGLQLPTNYYLLDVSRFDYIGIFKTTGSIIPFTLFQYRELGSATGTPVVASASTRALAANAAILGTVASSSVTRF